MKRKAFPLLLLAIAASACGPLPTNGPDDIVSYSMNGVKLIAADIPQGDVPSTFLQERYQLGPNRRLLLRFEELESHVSDVFVSDGKKVEVQVSPSDENTSPDTLKASLKLCPVLKNWMMLATWRSAHPFNDGRWQAPGGDFADSSCVQASRTESGNLYFDVTSWFVDYARGRGQNFGLLLISTSGAAIAGDLSPSKSPRIQWVKTPCSGVFCGEKAKPSQGLNT